MGHALPQRSCISCRAKGVRGEMLRFICTPERHVHGDARKCLPGRGAWTCAREACLKSAVDKGRFARSFRSNVVAGDWRDLWTEAVPAARIREGKADSVRPQACVDAELRLQCRPLDVGPLEGSEHDED